MNKYLKSQNFKIDIQKILLKINKIYTKKLTNIFTIKYFVENNIVSFFV